MSTLDGNKKVAGVMTTNLEWPQFQANGRNFAYCGIGSAAQRHGRSVDTLPYALRIVLENLERQRLQNPKRIISDEDVRKCVWFETNRDSALSLSVPRVILPDSSGIPVLQDLAALRDAAEASGYSAQSVRPQIPVHLIVDHSLQVDHAGAAGAVARNLAIELGRNAERYRFLKWAQQAFPGFSIFPPGSGIIHQINLERVAPVVMTRGEGAGALAFPDLVLGGDSHTPMVNGIGVMGWGVGGIDAMTAILGLPYDFPLPEVVGVRLTGAMPAGVMTTDLVLHVTQRLRKEGVVASFVEYFGPALDTLSVPERCTLANMAPEYGATVGYFPIDGRTLTYIEATRGSEHRAFVEAYARINHLFRDATTPDPQFSRVIEIDLSQVDLSVAGPRRPQDRLSLGEVAEDFRTRLVTPLSEGGFARPEAQPGSIAANGNGGTMTDGAIAIAAITSCTNTSNPAVMLAAGLVAQKAEALGLRPPAHVKTSMAPGSRVVTRYLEKTGLLHSLEFLGFNVVGYGCTTCAGKSGPLDTEVASDIVERDLVAAAVLSGNRNFEGRIHKQIRANYIMSPPMVVAFALAGRIDIDLTREPLGHDRNAQPVYLADIWPAPEEIAPLEAVATHPDLIAEVYGGSATNDEWESIEAPTGATYRWDPASTYLLRPPFFDSEHTEPLPDRFDGMRVLGLYEDSLTTDHISPGGEIPLESAAGQYLSRAGVPQKSFNTYVGRRGNHEVMARATFANLRIRNRLTDGLEGGWTRDFSTGAVSTVHEAAMHYRAAKTPLLVIAGKEYGTGSSRDWAAKGTKLLGIRAVIAESYERIHRSNLIGMGVVPLLFSNGDGWRSLGLDGTEIFEIYGLHEGITAEKPITVIAGGAAEGKVFTVTADTRTRNERQMVLRGGLAQSVREHLQA